MIDARSLIALGAAGALLVAIAGAYATGHRHGLAAGQAAVIERINRDNEEAGDAAETWRADLRRCHADGGLFDFEAGTCDR